MIISRLVENYHKTWKGPPLEILLWGSLIILAPLQFLFVELPAWIPDSAYNGFGCWDLLPYSDPPVFLDPQTRTSRCAATLICSTGLQPRKAWELGNGNSLGSTLGESRHPRKRIPES